jgi:Arc/MetJ family transcription regulator
MNSTSIVINQDLLESATRITGVTNPVEVVEYALREIVRRRAQRGFLEPVGWTEQSEVQPTQALTSKVK